MFSPVGLPKPSSDMDFAAQPGYNGIFTDGMTWPEKKVWTFWDKQNGIVEEPER